MESDELILKEPKKDHSSRSKTRFPLQIQPA